MLLSTYSIGRFVLATKRILKSPCAFTQPALRRSSSELQGASLPLPTHHIGPPGPAPPMGLRLLLLQVVPLRELVPAAVAQVLPRLVRAAGKAEAVALHVHAPEVLPVDDHHGVVHAVDVPLEVFLLAPALGEVPVVQQVQFPFQLVLFALFPTAQVPPGVRLVADERERRLPFLRQVTTH